MTTLEKIWKSKTIKELFINIPYTALDWCAFFMVALYITNPLIKAFLAMYNDEWLDGDFFGYWHKYNPYILLYGGLLLIIYAVKLHIDGLLADMLKRIKHHPTIWLFGVFAVLMCLSTIVNGFPKFSLFGEYYSGGGLFGTLSYLVYFLLVCLCMKQKHIALFCKIFAFTSIFILLLTAYDHIVLKRYIDYILGNGVFSNSNHYGYYLTVVALFFAIMFLNSKILWNKVIHLIIFMFTIGVMAINDTIGCLLAVIIGLIFTCIVYSIKNRHLSVATLFLIIAFFATYIFGYLCSDTIKHNVDANLAQFENDFNAMAGEEHHGSSGVARLLLWERTCVHISEKPLLGFAFDGAHQRLKEEADWGRCHCDYLHYAVCFGIPAAIVYVVALFLIFLRGLKYKNKLTDTNLLGLCAAFAYLISAAVGNTMHYTAPLLFIMAGLGYYKHKDC